MSFNDDLHQGPSLKGVPVGGAVTIYVPTWLTTAMIEWNALPPILTLEVWQALCLS